MKNQKTKKKKIKSFTIKDVIRNNLSLLSVNDLWEQHDYYEIFNKIDKN